jgi:hypothetical protein
MTALRYGISDTLVLAKRSLLRIPRQPDLLVGFTIQPILFVLLFVYVFGGAIRTPGFTYVDFLMPGIIVQSIVFGGFVTALGLADDLKKGLMDRFRSVPCSSESRPGTTSGWPWCGPSRSSPSSPRSRRGATGASSRVDSATAGVHVHERHQLGGHHHERPHHVVVLVLEDVAVVHVAAAEDLEPDDDVDDLVRVDADGVL